MRGTPAGPANTDVDANTTHRTSDGSDHTYINQDVTTAGSPTFDGIASTGAVTVDNTSNSTSTTTGSIQTDGGLGVALDTNLGGNVEVHGNQLLVSGLSGSVYVGGVTNTGDDGLRMHHSSNGSSYIDYKGSGNLLFRADNFSSGTTRMTIDSSSGAVTIFGNLSKASGSFKIDHPLPEMEDTHHLYHSFVEGPRADNIYRGVVTLVAGTATVNLDEVSCMTEGTFAALNKNVQAFTTNEQTWDNVRGSVSGNILTIECQDATATIEVSWLVIGERQDAAIMNAPWVDTEGGNCIEQPKSGGA